MTGPSARGGGQRCCVVWPMRPMWHRGQRSGVTVESPGCTDFPWHPNKRDTVPGTAALDIGENRRDRRVDGRGQCLWHLPDVHDRSSHDRHRPSHGHLRVRQAAARAHTTDLLGFEASDGTWATNLPGRPTGLRANGGSGSDGQGSIDMVLQPVPPLGPLQVYFAWPHFGIDETRHTLDAEPFAAAADQVTTLWPATEPAPDGIDFNDRRTAELGVPGGGWFAAALEKQKPPPRDPNAPRRINFALTSDPPEK